MSDENITSFIYCKPDKWKYISIILIFQINFDLYQINSALNENSRKFMLSPQILSN